VGVAVLGSSVGVGVGSSVACTSVVVASGGGLLRS
jgi:hypothetical protein